MSIFGIFSVVNGPHFVTHTIPYDVFKFSMVPTSHHMRCAHDIIFGFSSRRELGTNLVNNELSMKNSSDLQFVRFSPVGKGTLLKAFSSILLSPGGERALDTGHKVGVLFTDFR